ncbi:hypothetical protein VTP01DRAFT_7220 [Rhizomucor pusillus]|uniref:uncharacterized protein n=1 Tax=Rhizomucor pusillus TaxID=4840 RepID=UPI003743B990
MHTQEKPPAYGQLVTIQPPPPPYIARESEYSPFPLLNTEQFLTYAPPPSTVYCRYNNNERLYSSRFRSTLSSWKSVIYEARWTFLGCCSCILVMLVIIVTIFAYAPQLHSARLHKL